MDSSHSSTKNDGKGAAEEPEPAEEPEAVEEPEAAEVGAAADATPTVDAGPAADPVRKKLDAAKSSKRALRVVGEDDVSFDSAKSITEQRDLIDPGLDDFDKRLREKTGGQ